MKLKKAIRIMEESIESDELLLAHLNKAIPTMQKDQHTLRSKLGNKKGNLTFLKALEDGTYE